MITVQHSQAIAQPNVRNTRQDSFLVAYRDGIGNAPGFRTIVAVTFGTQRIEAITALGMAVATLGQIALGVCLIAVRNESENSVICSTAIGALTGAVGGYLSGAWAGRSYINDDTRQRDFMQLNAASAIGGICGMFTGLVAGGIEGAVLSQVLN